jgi:DNA-binding NarL/FixJ family response regulator
VRNRVRVRVMAPDPVSASGVASELRARPEVMVLEDAASERADVAVVVCDVVDAATAQRVAAAQRCCPRVVMVVSHLDDPGLMAAVGTGAVGILRRSEAGSDNLAHAVVAAARGNGALPPDLVARLLEQVGQLQRQVLTPRGLSVSGFRDRELDVLRLLSEGWDTGEIAEKLSYSERTVKTVIHEVVSRLQLRNRCHAVAYALRQGLI